jgi:PAS domain S-box-containing protein
MMYKIIFSPFFKKKIKLRTSRFDYNVSDTKEKRIAKSLILIISILCSFCGLVWGGIYYFFLGFGLTTMLPLIFAVIVIPTIFISHYACNYKILVHTQIICISLVPALIQWSLGSINDSGFVIVWCFLSPLGASLFLTNKHAKIWMFIFLSIIAVTVIITPTFSLDSAKVTKSAQILFYLMNIEVPFLIVFFATAYFLNELKRERERFFSLSVSESVGKEMSQFFKTANTPIFGIDSEGLVNEWNETSEQITGFTKGEVLGKDLVQTYITEDYRESVKKVLNDALLGEETANYEFPLFTKEGQRVTILLNSSTRRDIKGKTIGVLGVGQDITELAGYRNELELKVNERTLKLNQALEKQKELTRLKSRFISTASHEFRTPLSAINFAAGSIKNYWAKMNSDIIEKKLEKIEDQVMHMTKLLDDILIFGQAEAGKLRQTPLNINLGDFISEIIEEVYGSFNKSHDIVIIDKTKLKNSDIFIDEKLGRNIFVNLIGNAVKYSPDAKKVIVELSSEKNYLIISIIDFGIGISKSELKNIFTPFSRGENVDLIQGTGLGLSIAKEAIDAIGGEIIVNSNIGEGTSFIVKILKN